MDNSVLNADRVNQIFCDCLYKDSEDTSGLVRAEGINCTVGFNPDRLETHKVEIEEMLGELPDGFKESIGGGWSFLMATHDKHGNQWTGFHRRMEQLFQLGIAIGKVKCLTPRELWSSLPCGMPYYAVS